MAIYTYSDFEKAAKDAGLLGEFSDADLRLAQSNPDAGMSLLKYKTDFKNAATEEAKALANTGAEQIRSSYGGYTGGGDGGSFHLDPLSPNDFTYSEAPNYSSRYDGKINQLVDAITNRKEFSYDPDKDPLYSQVKKTYTREGRRATADALADAAAATGGVPSSYAVTAATQAGDYYASQMSDKLQDLYQLAYNKYIQDHSMKISDLEAVQSAEQADYQKYLNELNQYNTDRSFSYSKHIDEINNQTNKRNEELTKAELAASVGDYSLLSKMGIEADTETEKENTAYERQFELAKIAASAGDYSYLEKLLGGKIGTPAVSVSGYTGTSPAPGYTAGYDKERFDADLAFAEKRDKAEGTTKYTAKVYADYDAGKYGDVSETEQDTEGLKDPDLDVTPASVSDFKFPTETQRNNMAYMYLKKALPSMDILKEADWNKAKASNSGNSSLYNTYEDYLNGLFDWLY